jgi:hemoglobin
MNPEQPQPQSVYDLIGGGTKLRELVDRFYDLMYIERFGHPRLRARHLPYAIASSERDQWLRCMALAMQDVGLPEALQQRLLESFYQTADWMRNREG